MPPRRRTTTKRHERRRKPSESPEHRSMTRAQINIAFLTARGFVAMLLDMAKDLHERIVEAESRAGMHLGNHNEEKARGALKAAETSLRKSQWWLDRANDLRGYGAEVQTALTSGQWAMLNAASRIQDGAVVRGSMKHRTARKLEALGFGKLETSGALVGARLISFGARFIINDQGRARLTLSRAGKNGR